MPVLDLGVVALRAEATIKKATPTHVVDLGAVALAVAPTTSVALPQPGTLAAPYATTDGAAGNPVRFAGALSVATEPKVIVGAADAPSVWYVLTASEAEDLTALTSSFAADTQIEIYTGHPNAKTKDDITLIAFTGSVPTDLGTVALDGTAAISAALA